MSLNINLSDPSVRRLLGDEPSALARPHKREMVQLAGDAPDPTGMTSHAGMQSTMRLSESAVCHPLIQYKDFVMTADVYHVAGEPPFVHLICPRCRNTLTIPGQRKHIEYETTGGPDNAGTISIEAFECTWELEGHVRRMEFGLGLCRWKVAIDKNIAKDA
ncbi:MAG TPA: hypothetical protein VGM94_01060 [Galbitalea sp.]|jgi:hypothetical protein